jgi:acetyl-CoA synthetase
LLEGQQVTAAQLLEFGANNLAKYKAPKIVHIMDQFPRTKNGKVIRKSLVKEFSKEQP